LAELAQLGPAELVTQLGLAHEEDLDELPPRRLEIREHPHFLEHGGGQVLGLVDDDDDVSPGRCLLQEVVVQRVDHLDPPHARTGQLEVPEHELQELHEAHGRVEDEDGSDIRPESTEEVTDQGRLPGADLSEDQDESLALLYAVDRGGQGLFVRLAHEQVARVWREGKRALTQSIELRVHRSL
jgi:hypothetical protein